MREAQAIPLDRPLGLGAKAALVVEIAGAYVRARLLLRRAGLPRTLELLRAPAARARAAGGVADGASIGRRLAPVVVRTLAPLPADSRCLMRSLVLTRILARRGIDTLLVIAVRPGERFAAHAWIEHEGVALLPSDAPSFERLVGL